MGSWIEFIYAVLIGIALLYVPACWALNKSGMPLVKAIVLSPLVGLGVFCILGEVLVLLQVSVQPAVLWLASFAVCSGIGFVLSKTTDFKRVNASDEFTDVRESLSNDIPIKFTALYVFVGIVGCIICFTSVITTPEHFCQSYDMGHHIDCSRAFLDSGMFSSLKQGYYMTVQDQAINPWPGLSFYPSAYHFLAASIASFKVASMPVAINALNCVFMGCVFPLSVLAFLHEVCKANKLVLFSGALFVESFTIFPWGFLVYGPLYPNLAAFASMLIVATLFIGLFQKHIRWNFRMSLVVWFALSSLGLFLLHPNAIFALAVILMPFCAYQIASYPTKWTQAKACWIKGVVLVGFLLVWVGFFVAAHNTSAVQKAAEFDWGIIMSVEWGIINILRMSYVGNFFVDPPQYIPATALFLGILASIKKKQYRWLVASYMLVCAALFINATQDTPLKHFIGSFYYTDPYRFGALASICAIPLCAIGFAWLLDGIKRAFIVWNLKINPLPIMVLLVGAVAWVNMAPLKGSVADLQFLWGDGLEYPLGAIRERIGHDIEDSAVYTDEKRSFVQEVQKLIEPDALVVNIASDSSRFAYGADGLRVYYRPLTGYADGEDTEASQLIRHALKDYATNPAVQGAVHAVGAKYVLVLTDPYVPETNELFDSEFEGILGIDENTPGFELLYKKGAYKLYRIQEV